MGALMSQRVPLADLMRLSLLNLCLFQAELSKLLEELRSDFCHCRRMQGEFMSGDGHGMFNLVSLTVVLA